MAPTLAAIDASWRIGGSADDLIRVAEAATGDRILFAGQTSTAGYPSAGPAGLNGFAGWRMIAPVDPCQQAPFTLSMTGWPSATPGASGWTYTATTPGTIVTASATWSTVSLMDSRGCTVAAQR